MDNTAILFFLTLFKRFFLELVRYYNDFECFRENKGMVGNWLYNLNKCISSGADYIAICEGDD